MTRVSVRRPFMPTPHDIAVRVLGMLREAPVVLVVFADHRLWVTNRTELMDDEQLVARYDRYRTPSGAWQIENDIEQFFKEKKK